MVKLKLLYLFVIISVHTILSQTYYVDSNYGNDLNSGTSSKNAWKTINKINNYEFQPGDSILFLSNCEWREEIDLKRGGDFNNSIFIGSYGIGKKPRILGSETITRFDSKTKNIWSFELNKKIGWLWFIEGESEINWGSLKSNAKNLKSNFDFYFDSTSVTFFYDKDSLINELQIECSVRDFGIITGWYNKPVNYITVNNLEICFTKNANLRLVGGTNWNIVNLNLHHSGTLNETDGQGVQIEGENNLISKCEIYENGQHGVFISSFGNYKVKNNIIEQNILFNNYHTAIDLMNDGGDSNSHSKTIIRRNLIYDNLDFEGNEIGIQTLGYGNGTVKNVFIHHNILQQIKGIGISVMQNSDSIFIHNNTVYETQSACININNGFGFVDVQNNIGVNNNYYAALFLRVLQNKIVDYNTWYTQESSPTKNVFVIDTYYSNLKDYQINNSIGLNSTFKDPLILIKTGFISGFDPSSPCIDRGINLNYENDYFGNLIDENADIGAIEYQIRNE